MKTRRKSLFKRGLSFFIAMTMCLSMLQMPVFAAEENFSKESTAVEVSVQEDSSEGSLSEKTSSEEASEKEDAADSDSGEEKSADVDSEGEKEEGNKDVSVNDTEDGKDAVNNAGNEEKTEGDDLKEKDVADQVLNQEETEVKDDNSVVNDSSEKVSDKETTADDYSETENKDKVLEEEKPAEEEPDKKLTDTENLDKGKPAGAAVPEKNTQGSTGNKTSSQEKPSIKNPGAVKAFLNAVAAIPEITPENAEEAAEYIYGEVAEAYEEIAGTEDENREEVQEAAAVMAEAMEAVDAALKIAETKNHAAIEDFMEVCNTMGDADDIESTLAALDEIEKVYDRLSDKDKGAVADEWAYIQAYMADVRNGKPDEELEVLALIRGEQFYVNVIKVVNGKAVDTKSLLEKCLQSTGHSGYNHSTNLHTLASKSGFNGYKGYNWSKYTTVPSTYTSGLVPNNNYTSVHYNITGNAPYTANETLFLFFEEKKTFTLKYNANGGSGAPAQQTATSTEDSYTFTISSTTPTRSGYDFLGWSTSSTATSASYLPNGEIMVTGTTTLYAVWKIKEEQKVTLKYMDRGTLYCSETHNKGSKVTIKDCTNVHQDYLFKGWDLDESADEVCFEPSDIMMLTSDCILYAVWEKDESLDGTPDISTTKQLLYVKAPDGSFRYDGKAQPGDIIYYQIIVTNNSDKEVTGVVIVDKLDKYLEFVEAKGTGGYWGSEPADSCFTFSKRLLPVNDKDNNHVTLTITAKVKDDAPNGTISNIALARCDGLDEPKESNKVDVPVEKPDPKPAEFIVTVKYQDEEGKKLKDDATEETTEHGKYDVTDKKVGIEGYTYQRADRDLSGTVTENITITLIYKKNTTPDPTPIDPKPEEPDPERYKVIVHYVYTDGGKAAEDEIRSDLSEGDDYYITSPDIEGYTPDRSVVEGTMGTKDIEITVTYTKKGGSGEGPDKPEIPDTPDSEKITATWLPGYGDNAPIQTEEYNKGTTKVPDEDYPEDPFREGYTFNGWGSPVIDADGNITIIAQWTPVGEVTNPETHKVTVHYVYTDGSKAADDEVRDNLTEGTAYSIPSPGINGYTPDQIAVNGTMGKEDIVLTVTYTRDSTGNPGGGSSGGGGGGSTATNQTGRVHGTTPSPESEVTVPGDGVPLAEIPEGTNIADEDVPLAGIPAVDIPDADVPLAGIPDLMYIPNDDVPLARVPKTGDSSGLWHMMALLSAFGLMAVTMIDRKKHQEKQ